MMDYETWLVRQHIFDDNNLQITISWRCQYVNRTTWYPTRKSEMLKSCTLSCFLQQSIVLLPSPSFHCNSQPGTKNHRICIVHICCSSLCNLKCLFLSVYNFESCIWSYLPSGHSIPRIHVEVVQSSIRLLSRSGSILVFTFGWHHLRPEWVIFLLWNLSIGHWTHSTQTSPTGSFSCTGAGRTLVLQQ